MTQEKNKISIIQCILTIIHVVCLILSNILVIKTIDLFGIKQLPTTCAIFTFSITYILSDVFSEVYGFKWSRFSGIMATIGTIIASILFSISIRVPGNDTFMYQYEFETIFGTSFKIAFASILAFFSGDFVDDIVFEKMKKRGGKFSYRAILSSLCGEIVDSTIFMSIIFIGKISTKQLIAMYTTEIFTKVFYEIIILPITIYLVKVLKND